VRVITARLEKAWQSRV